MNENIYTQLVADFAAANGFTFYQGAQASPALIRNWENGSLKIHFVSYGNDGQTASWHFINEGFSHPVSHKGTSIDELTDWINNTITPQLA